MKHFWKTQERSLKHEKDLYMAQRPVLLGSDRSTAQPGFRIHGNAVQQIQCPLILKSLLFSTIKQVRYERGAEQPQSDDDSKYSAGTWFDANCAPVFFSTGDNVWGLAGRR